MSVQIGGKANKDPKPEAPTGGVRAGGVSKAGGDAFAPLRKLAGRYHESEGQTKTLRNAADGTRHTLNGSNLTRQQREMVELFEEMERTNMSEPACERAFDESAALVDRLRGRIDKLQKDLRNAELVSLMASGVVGEKREREAIERLNEAVAARDRAVKANEAAKKAHPAPKPAAAAEPAEGADDEDGEDGADEAPGKHPEVVAAQKAQRAATTAVRKAREAYAEVLRATAKTDGERAVVDDKVEIVALRAEKRVDEELYAQLTRAPSEDAAVKRRIAALEAADAKMLVKIKALKAKRDKTLEEFAAEQAKAEAKAARAPKKPEPEEPAAAAADDEDDDDDV